jgi:hypothetical protein
LDTLPNFDFSSATSIDFSNSYNLLSIPYLNWKTSGTVSLNVSNCYNLTTIPAVYTTTLNVTNCYTLKDCQSYGMIVNFTIANTKLNKTALNQLFVNLGIPASTQTLTITGALGAILFPNVTKTAGTLDSTSNTIAFSDTSGLVVGMQGTSSAIGFNGTHVGVNFDAGTDKISPVTVDNGAMVSFTTVPTGMTAYQIYYVVNTDKLNTTCQVSTTPGGAPVNFTTSPSGVTMLYIPQIISIVPNVSVTFNMNPLSNSASGSTFTFRELLTRVGVLKRWTVTG